FSIHQVGSVAVHSSLSSILEAGSRASCDLTIAIKPEKWGGTNWTKVSIKDSFDTASSNAGRSQGRCVNARPILKSDRRWVWTWRILVHVGCRCPSARRSIIRRGLHHEEDRGANFPCRFSIG